nr:hypothetical protein [Bradyrhizobium diazoefficiens]
MPSAHQVVVHAAAVDVIVAVGTPKTVSALAAIEEVVAGVA